MRRTRPLIGITTYLTRARWGAWDCPAALLPALYTTHVQRAGGAVLMLPPDDPAHAAGLLDAVDGLVLAGGDDVDPALYDAVAHPRTGTPVPERDRWELALLEAALEADVPVLGICRGMQLMNVRAGGTLCQHLPDEVGHTGHNPAPGVFHDHAVVPVPGTLTASLLPARLDVATHHHQSVADVGKDLVVSAHADDGTVEAVEYQDRAFALGVQWHPEARDDLRLAKALVGAAAGQS
ncbi:gamma-glutamyl-gamma-aminobutyrate hydrolase family protein [Streptomyces sp. NPDC049585]|uniref:gamma-glutamyl-gamma-aminobutyrate hydrolase family protein n=1 Tax=Streptomyces sp. NPDC049585 TaxID=3155154 RepID=UPI00344AB2C0